MKSKLTSEFKRAHVKKLLELLDGIDYGAEKALYKTLVATQKKAKTDASKLIRDGSTGSNGLNLSKKYVDGKLKVGKPSYSNLTARVYAGRRGVLLTNFPYKKLVRKGGYSVNVTGLKKRIAGAFLINPLKYSGKAGIAIRKNGKLEVLHGPSVSQALNTHLESLQESMADYSHGRLAKEVAEVLRRAG
ncbi:MAG: hypothetical protein PF440_06310 [Thiomicrorhabdus sp.]|jgi:hypothetical protein|nr:hypothetical protein [Thiomicrorhabdus sp.]